MRYKTLAVISYCVSAFFVGVGFYKLFVYQNSDDILFMDKNVNAYVGGDAYNYIINSGQATAYFILALTFVVLGCTFLICNCLLFSHRKTQENDDLELLNK